MGAWGANDSKPLQRYNKKNEIAIENGEKIVAEKCSKS